MSADVQAELVQAVAGFTHDPLGFVLFAFPWGEGELANHPSGPRQWQRDVLTDIATRLWAGESAGDAIQLATASGHGIGKSALVSWLILWAMSTFEDCKVVVTANTEAQLRTKTWPEVAKWHRLAINSHWFKFTATSLFSVDQQHEKTWRADAIPWSESNTEAFAGLHNQGRRIVLVFDEASAIADKVWEVAEGALTDADTEIIWAAFGNPTRNTGRFRECFRRLRHRWLSRQIDSRTVEGVNRTQLDKWVEDYGEDSDFVKVRVRGMFPASSFKQFISEADVDAAFGRDLRPESYQWAPKIIGVDPAWAGDDEFTIVMRQGLYSIVLATFPKNDNDVEMANIIARLEDQHQADAVFIDGGYGTGIVSVGRTLGRSWQLVWFSSKPNDPGMLNKRAEMWRDLRDWLKSGGAIPPDHTLHDELIAPETVPRLDGKVQLESKEDMKRRGVPSPNRADALALTFAYPVARRQLNQHKRPAPKARTEYEPI